LILTFDLEAQMIRKLEWMSVYRKTSSLHGIQPFGPTTTLEILTHPAGSITHPLTLEIEPKS